MMKRLIALAVLWAGAAFAQPPYINDVDHPPPPPVLMIRDVGKLYFGQADNLTKIDVIPTHDGAEVRVLNTLTTMLPMEPLDFEIDGVVGTVVYIPGDGTTQDTVIVVPPAGWQAIPESMNLREFEEGSIFVVPHLLG